MGAFLSKQNRLGKSRRALLASELLKKVTNTKSLDEQENAIWVLAAASLIADDPALPLAKRKLRELVGQTVTPRRDTNLGDWAWPFDYRGGSADIVAYSLDGTRIVAGSDEGEVKIWDSRTGAEMATLSCHEQMVTGVMFSPDGTKVLTNSEDKACLWDAASGAEIACMRGHQDWVISAVFSSDGTVAVQRP